MNTRICRRPWRACALVLAAIVALAALGGVVPPPALADDPKPATNDFILRAPAAEVSGIAARNGLTVITTVDTPTDSQGRSVYLVRAAASADPELVIEDVETLEPEAAGIEEVFLASMPELDQSAMIILDATSIVSSLGAIHGFAPPSATIDATWNTHFHDRELEADKTAQLKLVFEHAATTDPAAYTFEVDFAGGRSSIYDPATCVAVVKQGLEVGGDKAKWLVVNTSAGTLTVDEIAAGWPAANGDLLEVKFDGNVIFDQAQAPSSVALTGGWTGDATDRQLAAGDTVDLELRWQNSADLEVTAYSLSLDTVEGHGDQYDPAGGGCVAHIDEQVAFSGSEVVLDLSNYGATDLLLDLVVVGWPAANGKLMTAHFDGESLLDDPYRKFGKDANGDDRYVWEAYVNQFGTVQLEVDEAQRDFKGRATVAVIDTGIDPAHPLLADVVLPGYDFINDVADGSERLDVDQSAMIILDQSAMIILDGSDVVPLSQSAMIILDDQQELDLDVSTLPDAFGHGTMVAGIIHRVAPEAELMPLKAFDGNGNGNLFDIVEAIYYAVDNGANVINMSFSMKTYSPELMRAINYATRRGVACIAAGGNLGEETLVFPASFGNALGVAATNEANELAAFSNYGSDLVTISAPGENVVTTYPGGGWALASGTSFAAPWISGAAAIFADKLGTKGAPGSADFYLSSNALAWADPVGGSGQGKSGHGRANLRRAVEKVRSGRYAADRPLGQYSLSADFAEGCAAHYPPPGTGGGCVADGAAQLKFDGKKVYWRVTNDGETAITLDTLTIDWPLDNGELRKIKIDDETIDDTTRPATFSSAGPTWLGTAGDRLLAPHQTRVVVFEFEHDVVWTY